MKKLTLLILLASHFATAADFQPAPPPEDVQEALLAALKNGRNTAAMVEYIDAIATVPFSSDIYEISFKGGNNEILYVSKDGGYIFQADIIAVPDALNISRERRDALAAAKGLSFTTQVDELRACNCFIVTVPTPIDCHKRPDLTPLLRASEIVGSVLKAGDIVIYESTVYPGCTEEDCVPVLEKVSGLKFNRDFFVGYSPERINPGDKAHRLTTIRKVTSGSTPEIAAQVDALYNEIISVGTHPAPSIKFNANLGTLKNVGRLKTSPKI